MTIGNQYTIAGPAQDSEDDINDTAHRSLSIRRGGKSDSLRLLYRSTASPATQETGDVSNSVAASPHLPPTPPGAEDDEQEVGEGSPDLEHEKSKRSLITPINQQSPPTPDNTPPARKHPRSDRLGLDVRPSFIYSQADSFRTAREDLPSDTESQFATSARFYSFQSLRQTPPALPRPLVDLEGSPTPSTKRVLDRSNRPIDRLTPNGLVKTNGSAQQPDSAQLPTDSPFLPEGFRHVRPEDVARRLSFQNDATENEVHPTNDPSPAHHPSLRHSVVSFDAPRVRRDPSLRDRITSNHVLSPSTERFASIIGWTEAVPLDSPKDTRRWSGLSTGSAIGALVFDTPQTLPRRKTTLRHVGRHESLRSVSSPVPVSNRASLNSNSNSDSPHRLSHKKAQVTNHHRWSYGSEVSKTHSMASSAVLPKTEVIRVAIIPERRSSLSASNSKRNSQITAVSDGSRRFSEDTPSKVVKEDSDSFGKDRRYPPVVPQRRSSLSAPTSARTSRANSISSEHLSVRRQEAEIDLRRTLERMESERLVTSLKQMETGESVNTPRTTRPRTISIIANEALLPSNSNNGGRTPRFEPGGEDWADLRTTSLATWTPFSHPSGKSTSPIETGEAQTINYFQHHNHSLQVIESNAQPESRAVKAVRKRQIHLENLAVPPVDSPLRNPRAAPQPPNVSVVSPSSAGENDRQKMERYGSLRRDLGFQRRPQPHSRSESFVQSLSRGLSLKNARNKKADQDLDGNLHPFWRPKAFWDDSNDARRYHDKDNGEEEQSVISNSVGLPQERTTISGPSSLIRRISQRRQNKKALRQRSSYSSLSRVQAGSKMIFLSGSKVPMQVGDQRGWRDWLLYARRTKEDERRERRRAELRQRIGNVVAQTGDSRFPASGTNLARPDELPHWRPGGQSGMVIEQTGKPRHSANGMNLGGQDELPHWRPGGQGENIVEPSGDSRLQAKRTSPAGSQELPHWRPGGQQWEHISRHTGGRKIPEVETDPAGSDDLPHWRPGRW